MPLPPTPDRRHQPRIEFELAGARLEIERTPSRGTPRAVSLPRDAATETIARALSNGFFALQTAWMALDGQMVFAHVDEDPGEQPRFWHCPLEDLRRRGRRHHDVTTSAAGELFEESNVHFEAPRSVLHLPAVAVPEAVGRGAALRAHAIDLRYRHRDSRGRAASSRESPNGHSFRTRLDGGVGCDWPDDFLRSPCSFSRVRTVFSLRPERRVSFATT